MATMIRKLASLLVGLVLAMSVPTLAQTTRPVRGESPVVKLPSYGITVRTPAGWTRMLEPNIETAIYWARVNDAQKQLEGLMRIEIQPAQGTLQESAKAIASRAGLTISPKPVRLGAAPAVELTGSVPTDGKAEVYLALGRLAVRGKHSYGLYYFSPRGAKVNQAAFEQVAASVVLSDPVAPSTAITARERPFPLLKSGMVFSPQDPFRQTEATDVGQTFTAYNFVAGLAEATITVAHGPKNVNTMDEFKEAMVNIANTGLGITGALTWTDVSSAPAVAYSNAVTMPRPGDGKPTPVRFINVLNDGHSLLFITDWDLGDKEAAKRYAAVAGDLARTIRISTAYFEGYEGK